VQHRSVTLAAACALAGILAGACVERDRLNADCAWTHDVLLPLDLQRPADAGHLRDDATVAEALAIRYADAKRGHRSGHYLGDTEYAAERERCMTTLFGVIARTHRVNSQAIRQALQQRPIAWDATVAIVFTLLYVFAASGFIGWLGRRFPADAPIVTWTATGIAAIMASAAGVVAFEIAVGIVESVRLRDTHLSYRTAGLPWRHDRIELLAAGAILFLAIAVMRRPPSDARL
jgi:hypothetical protein